jgi:hypothetical protein
MTEQADYRLIQQLELELFGEVFTQTPTKTAEELIREQYVRPIVETVNRQLYVKGGAEIVRDQPPEDLIERNWPKYG